MGEELWRKTATDLAAGIADGTVSSREVVQSHLDRIAEVNHSINAVVRVLTEDALRMADDADKAVRSGVALGPLHGVPFTIKENIDVGGLPTTHGVPLFAHAIAPHDAPTVERMKAAGAIPLARTNLPDMGLRIHTDSTLYGRTKNPWKSDRTAGGSSGGEGAALATGMSPIGLGNDIGGSLRNPAHACGISAIKPSFGVVPHVNTFPTSDRSLSSQMMLNQGVMARSIGDVRRGFSVIAGPDPRDPLSLPVSLKDLESNEKITVAVVSDPPGGSTHSGVSDAVKQAADVLSNAGHNVVEATPPDMELAYLLWAQMLLCELHDIRDQIEMVMGPGGLTFISNGLEMFPKMSTLDTYAMNTQRDGLARKWSLWFEQYQVVVLPTWSQPAFVADYDIQNVEGSMETFELMRPVLPGNLLGLPGVVTSAGMADGLPIGVQVMGARYTDLRCLSIAEVVESVIGVSTPIDPRD